MTIDLEAIRKRAEAATEGPWQRKYDIMVSDTELIQIIGNVDTNWHGDGLCYTDICEISESTEETGNATFIAHAREDIPALLSHIAALEAAHEAELLGVMDAVGAVYRAVECNAAPINVIAALKELAADEDRWITLAPNLLIDLFTAYRAQKEKK